MRNYSAYAIEFDFIHLNEKTITAIIEFIVFVSYYRLFFSRIFYRSAGNASVEMLFCYR